MNETISYEKIKDYIELTKEEIRAVFANAGDEESTTPEEVARLIRKMVTIIRFEQDGGQIFIYNQNGKYDVGEEWILQCLFKYILNQAGYSWNLKFEREALGALKRDSTIVVKEFNNSNCLNFKNGVFSLDDGMLHPHNPQNTLFTYILDYEYDKNAKCPYFLKFLEETTCHDKQLQEVLKEIIGYCLSNKTFCEKSFFWYGSGCNGKSVLASTVHKLVGEEQTCAVSLDSLNKNFSLSAFIGKKLNIAPENEKLSDSEKIKTLVSCDKLNISIKYKEDWVGKLYCKHIFLMNELPVTPDVTYGFFRKILIIPFNNTVKNEDIDRDLPKKISSELPGIFNWAYEGYLRLVANNYNFSQCDIIDKFMSEYRNRENPTGEFFNAVYEPCSEGRIKKSTIYPKYVEWAADTGHTTMTRNKFLTSLKLKASETGSGINLDYREINGYMYLFGYKERISKIQDDDILDDKPIDYDF